MRISYTSIGKLSKLELVYAKRCLHRHDSTLSLPRFIYTIAYYPSMMLFSAATPVSGFPSRLDDALARYSQPPGCANMGPMAYS